MAENNVDFSCYSSALMQGYSCDSCHRQPNSGTKFERLCPSHAHLAGLWLLDSGASDHSTPYLEDFLTYKKLAKPVRVQTAGKEIIWFPGIGTVAFTTTVQGRQKKIVFHKCYYSPSGDKQICSLQWLTTQLGMTYKADVKTTQVFDSRGHAFLEGTRLLP